jgi:uncharacterized caspase-like protein
MNGQDANLTRTGHVRRNGLLWSIAGFAAALTRWPANAQTASQVESAIGRRGADAPQTQALLIGLDYKAAAPALHLANTLADVALVEACLRRIGVKQIRALSNPDSAAFATALDRYLSSLSRTSIALIYYAGHGVQIEGHNLMLLADGDSFLDMAEVIAAVRSKVDVAVFILDACRNNPFAQIDNAPPPPGRRLALNTAARSGRVGVSVRSAPMTSAPASAGGLARFDLVGSGVKIVFATDPGNVALDRDPRNGANGPFATALAARLTEQRSFDDVIATVTGDVLAVTGEAQAPWQQGSLPRALFLAGRDRAQNPTVTPFRVPG